MTAWYLCAKNDHPPTMKYLVQVVGEQNIECLHKDRKCADGKTRNLFRCPNGYADVQRVIVAIPEYGLKVEVFSEEIPYVITRFELWKPLVRKRKMHATLKRGIHRGSSMQK